jgi:hypothetical protein
VRPLTLFIILLFTGCAGDRMTIKATVAYIEPFPFASPLGHHAIQNTQAAWITRAETGDSLAVLFDYRTSGGDDIDKQISVGKVYLFTITPYKMTPSDAPSKPAGTPDSVSSLIRSLPIKSLLDSQLVVKADKFWLVLSVDRP